MIQTRLFYLPQVDVRQYVYLHLDYIYLSLSGNYLYLGYDELYDDPNVHARPHICLSSELAVLDLFY